ncbi:acrosomal protein SP-10-like isoform X2 [Lepus europaeus]|uniref:acrosomal protein SP-10-like isoform X2 n=1 Tax=Lepus europaeus TaxID=9983 RepID=UPI002B45E481|nr:acrosomal protein SP-10-like isoform X2 [Lepus europaeus]
MNKCILLMGLYLLGSARGASGQPDEPPGSMDHQSSIHQLSGENALIEHGSSEHGTSEHTSGDQPSGDQPSGEKSAAEMPSGEQISGELSAASGEHGSGEQAIVTSGEHGSGEQAAASGEQASAEKPSSAPIASTSSGLVDCHTCSFMTDEGECLHGEGVCTTQNSQQCMLKKIFEGGNLQLMVQGCENFCSSVNLYSRGIRMQITCCRNQSFCNKV